MNSLVDQNFINVLFEHEYFKTKMKAFIEGYEAQASPTTNDQQTKKLDSLATDIQKLLFKNYSKQQQLKTQNKCDCCRLESLELKRQIQLIHFKLTALETSSNINRDIAISSNSLQSRCNNLVRQQRSQCRILNTSFRQWEEALLEKVDLCGFRNASKMESIFTNKLNSFEMQIQEQLEVIRETVKNLSNEPIRQTNTKTMQETSAKQGQENLVAKLKNSRSFGNLIRFGK